MAKSRTKIERETIFGFNDGEDTAWIETTSPVLLRKLTRRLGPPKPMWPGATDSWSWIVPKDWIKLPRKKRKREGKVLTEAQKAAMQAGRKKTSTAK
jgi:hypothetical protein